MDPLITSSLISAGTSLLGGLFGSKKPKAQGIDYVKLRDDALKAGFNPLTALMAGGGAGYQREFNPALSSGSFIAEAIQRGADTYFNQKIARDDAEASAIADHDRRKELIAYEASLRPRASFGYALSEQAPYSPAVGGRVAALSRSKPAKDESPAQSDDAVDPAKKPITAFGLKFEPSGAFSDAETVETRYGDIPSGIYGAASTVYDVGHNLKGLQNWAHAKLLRSRGYTVRKIGGTYYASPPQAKPPLLSRGAKTQDVYRAIFGKKK